jgi:Fe-S oxidoreductase
MKFPELSSTIVTSKLDLVTKNGAAILATDCPGCIMQLRGAAEKQERPLEVLHTVEALSRQLKHKS